MFPGVRICPYKSYSKKTEFYSVEVIFLTKNNKPWLHSNQDWGLGLFSQHFRLRLWFLPYPNHSSKTTYLEDEHSFPLNFQYKVEIYLIHWIIWWHIICAEKDYFNQDV